jgi:hypothetical protein
LPLDHPDLATELAVRAEAALARGAAPARGKAVREKLCRLALENFRELPAPRMEPVNLARG